MNDIILVRVASSHLLSFYPFYSFLLPHMQWHPDRWAALPLYSTAVQGVFQLISEAYEALSASLLSPATGSADGATTTDGSTAASASATEPIYM
jgi:hypothetical protein